MDTSETDDLVAQLERTIAQTVADPLAVSRTAGAAPATIATSRGEMVAASRGAIVAYSGGADSALVAFIAHRVLGGNMLAVLAGSPLLSQGEAQRARENAAAMGIPYQEIRHPGWSSDFVRTNPRDRCYWCKRGLFARLGEMAAPRGWVVLHGENADDLTTDRPGERAAEELGCRAPLAEAGITKERVREISRFLGLPTADLPSSPCLATRFPYGEELTPEKLDRVRAAEAWLREDLGEQTLRVRSEAGTARVELPPATLAALSDTRRDKLTHHFIQLGFREVTIDPKGYRSGSFDA